MNSGQLNKLIKVFYTTGSVAGTKDQLKQWTPKFTTTQSIHAAIDPKALRQSMNNGIVYEAGTLVLTTRWYPFLSETAEFELNDTRYDIVSAYETLPRAWMQVIAKQKRS